MSLGKNIKTKRINLGLTQKELGHAVGVDRSMIAQIERGSKIPNLMLGRDIAEALGCSMEKLLEEV